MSQSDAPTIMTIGILGGGQLGQLLAEAAHRLGFKAITFSPEADSPASKVCDDAIVAEYTDREALQRFGEQVQVITYEFENIPTDSLAFLESFCPIRPGIQALAVSQNRLREKLFCHERGLPTAPFLPVHTLEELQEATEMLNFPCVLKSIAMGYDGKGQFKLSSAEDINKAWDALNGQPAVLEGWVAFEREVSVIGVRSLGGEFTAYPLIENRHQNGILDISVFPASVSEDTQHTAALWSHVLMEHLEMVGILCVEYFLMPQGNLIINEIAPRPHNSGHLTIEACSASQYEQQIRAICELPLASLQAVYPAAMVNLLGDVWSNGEPDWDALQQGDPISLYLYGKTEPKPGRKMGHISALGNSSQEALDKALQAKSKLMSSSA